MYISQDPIGLLGSNANLYAYVPDSNTWLDTFGLSSTALANSMKPATGGIKPVNTQAHHVIPEQIWNSNSSFFNDVGLAGQRDHFSNGIALPNSEAALKGSGHNIYHQGSHKNYNSMVGDRINTIKDAYKKGLLDKKGARIQVRKLQFEMRNKLAMGNVSTGHTKIRHSKRLH